MIVIHNENLAETKALCFDRKLRFAALCCRLLSYSDVMFPRWGFCPKLRAAKPIRQRQSLRFLHRSSAQSPRRWTPSGVLWTIIGVNTVLVSTPTVLPALLEKYDAFRERAPVDRRAAVNDFLARNVLLSGDNLQEGRLFVSCSQICHELDSATLDGRCSRTASCT